MDPLAHLRARLTYYRRTAAMLRQELAATKSAIAQQTLQATLDAIEDGIRDLDASIKRMSLPEGDRDGNTGDMVSAARVRISEGHGEGDPFVEALNNARHTVRSLAEELGVSHALLSQARAGKRSISLALAKRIEALTGFKATRKNWPKLRT